MQTEERHHFAPDTLKILNEAAEGQIEARRTDAPAKPVVIWIVVVNDDVYVRSYRVPLLLSAQTRTTAGVLLLTIVFIEYGGWFLLRLVRGAQPRD